MQDWPIRLFNKSVLKQRKYQEIVDQLGDTTGLHGLDIGSDNGVISYLLRQRGGTWASVDLDDEAVASIRAMVGDEVYQTDGRHLPFADDAFDVVIIIDMLEHLHDDRALVEEIARVLKPGGRLIINVPHDKRTPLRWFRHAIGQTDALHGHVRPGYTVADLQTLCGDLFTIQAHRTYSKFFSEFLDTLIRQAVALLKRGKQKDFAAEEATKGQIVTGEDLESSRKMFKFYSLIYPIFWLVSRLDYLLFFVSGYMLIVKAANKQTAN